MRNPNYISKFNLIKLSIPILLANLVVPLVGLVDTVLMGHLGSEKFLTAISISTTFMTMIFWSFGFLRMGTVGLVSQALGKGDYREIVSITVRNISIALILSLLIILLKNPIILIIDLIFKPEEYTSTLINSYISIRVFSAPAELIIYVLIGFYLGLQKTRTSSLIVIFFSIANIYFSIFFVQNMGLEIKGVVLGTLFSSYLTLTIFSIFTYFYVFNKFKIIPRFKKIFLKNKIKKLLNINFDIFVRTILLTFSFFWITYLSSKLGEDYVAINTILIQFIIFASFFLDAFAFSTESVVGFSLGRKSLKSFLLVVKNSFELSFFTGLIISVFYILFSKQIIGLITDLEMLKFISYSFIFWIVLIPPVASFCYQFDGIFIGASQTPEMRNAMIISVVAFILCSTYLVRYLDNHGIWLSLLLFMIFRSLTLNFYFSKIVKTF
jgi:multidrug resistance protein, MATE family